MSAAFILASESAGIATITLNRPDKCNAMHDLLLSELSSALKKLAGNDAIRVLIIQGSGKHFCAGADIAWFQTMAGGSAKQTHHNAQLLSDLLYQLYSFPKPTIVLAHGTTLGGGIGLLAAADIALAAPNAMFCFSEVKLGLTPSMISPYVITAIGERAANYYFITGKSFNSEEAHRIGLVHQLANATELLHVGHALAQDLLKNSPNAMKTAKQLIRDVVNTKITPALAQQTADHLATLSATPEAQEGLRAFLEKRLPKWS